MVRQQRIRLMGVPAVAYQAKVVFTIQAIRLVRGKVEHNLPVAAKGHTQQMHIPELWVPVEPVELVMPVEAVGVVATTVAAVEIMGAQCPDLPAVAQATLAVLPTRKLLRVI